MEKEFILPRPGACPVQVEKAICTNFKADAWSMSVIYRNRGKKFLSVLILETGKQYTHEVSK
jgi:hypothetical protein